MSAVIEKTFKRLRTETATRDEIRKSAEAARDEIRKSAEKTFDLAVAKLINAKSGEEKEKIIDEAWAPLSKVNNLSQPTVYYMLEERKRIAELINADRDGASVMPGHNNCILIGSDDESNPRGCNIIAVGNDKIKKSVAPRGQLIKIMPACASYDSDTKFENVCQVVGPEKPCTGGITHAQKLVAAYLRDSGCYIFGGLPRSEIAKTLGLEHPTDDIDVHCPEEEWPDAKALLSRVYGSRNLRWKIMEINTYGDKPVPVLKVYLDVIIDGTVHQTSVDLVDRMSEHVFFAANALGSLGGATIVNRLFTEIPTFMATVMKEMLDGKHVLRLNFPYYADLHKPKDLKVTIRTFFEQAMFRAGKMLERGFSIVAWVSPKSDGWHVSCKCAGGQTMGKKDFCENLYPSEHCECDWIYHCSKCDMQIDFRGNILNGTIWENDTPIEKPVVEPIEKPKVDVTQIEKPSAEFVEKPAVTPVEKPEPERKVEVFSDDGNDTVVEKPKPKKTKKEKAKKENAKKENAKKENAKKENAKPYQKKVEPVPHELINLVKKAVDANELEKALDLLMFPPV